VLEQDSDKKRRGKVVTLNPVPGIQSINIRGTLIVNEIYSTKNQERVPERRKDHGCVQLPVPKQTSPHFIV
jgi:hypothetical protein